MKPKICHLIHFILIGSFLFTTVVSHWERARAEQVRNCGLTKKIADLKT